MKKSVIYLAGALVLFSVSPQAKAVDINGTILLDYEARDNDVQIVASRQNDGFRVAQTNLRLSHDFSEWNRALVSVIGGGQALTLNEAWMSFGGLPYSGELVAGRFFKPLGAPLQTAGLSFPAILFHSSPVTGMKVGMENYPWRWEGGVASTNPLTATGGLIGGTTVFGRPAATITGHQKEIYGFIGWRDGGTWGSLDITGTYTHGKMTQADMATLNAVNIFPTRTGNESTRRILDFSADYTYGPWRLYGEYVQADEGKLQLTTYNIAGSRRLGDFNLTLGFDRLKNNATNRPLNVPASWHRDRITYGVEYEFSPRIRIRAEYEANDEEMTSVTRQGISNDAFRVQAVASI